MTDRKPLLCLDVDGVVHSYTSGWLGADRMPDPPVHGAMEAIRGYLGTFRVALYSSRTGQPNGLYAMQAWLLRHLVEAFGEQEGRAVAAQVEWPHSKPPAMVTLDDRALRFDGTWPSVERLAGFQPWNKRPLEDKAAVVRTVSEVVGQLWIDGFDRDDALSDSHALVLGLAERGYEIVRTA